MSYFWANTIWQSKDGSWARGYYTRISGANSGSLEDEDFGYNSEWDDDFDDSSFDYLATGLTREQAHDFTPAGNPGTYVEIAYRGNSKVCKELDLMAFHHNNPEAKAKHDRAIHNRKRREHFAELEKRWAGVDLERQLLVATIAGNDRVYDGAGAFTIVSGAPKVDGNWLTLEGRKILNTKTGKFHNRVHNVERSRYRRF